jgi:uncharacterized sulfatase
MHTAPVDSHRFDLSNDHNLLLSWLPGRIVALLVLIVFSQLCCTSHAAVRSADKPNIIYIMADDMGYGDLGCYGQQVIRTPHIDRLAAEGMRFTSHYSGHTVCRPSRLVLLTGMHSGHTAISSNAGHVLPANERTVTSLLKAAGYRTGGIGKWALGAPGTSGAPSKQGFDFWFGYLDQSNAHNYFPEYLWRNEQKVILPGNRVGDQKRVSVERQTYAHDLLTDAALEFIRSNADQPFFLQAHYNIPHANNEGGRATGNGSEIPDYGQYAEQDWPDVEKGFAAMVSRLDRDVGRMIELLKELQLEKNTLVIFTSDNGPHQEGGHKMEYFNSNGALRGYKRDLYEGGIRVPMIAWWPDTIQPATESDHPSAFWDFLPTACDLAGIETPDDIDGITFLPTLLGQDQPAHDHLYWQYNQKVAVRAGKWKAVRTAAGKPFELYNLDTDIGEQHDVAADHPQITEQLTQAAQQYAWTELFDGRSLSGWRAYQSDTAPDSGWSFNKGILHCDGTARKDLLTVEQFENYELEVEWKTEPDGNSGILVHADESTRRIAFNAPEVQIYATGERDPGIDHQAGALYALYPAKEETVLPPGAWNTTRIVAQGQRLAVWHNGIQICDAQVGSDEWQKKVAASKFAKSATFGTRTKGHIALQDHGSKVWFRKVRIRPLNR